MRENGRRVDSGAGRSRPSPGTGEGATATVAGVQVVARSKAWHWDPTDLDSKVTPVLVEFQNNGDRPVIVRYNHISLMDDAGNRFT